VRWLFSVAVAGRCIFLALDLCAGSEAVIFSRRRCGSATNSFTGLSFSARPLVLPLSSAGSCKSLLTLLLDFSPSDEYSNFLL
jgi:hypothetical protein